MDWSLILSWSFFVSLILAAIRLAMPVLCAILGEIITELSGLHAGLNPISGDFSLIAKGQLVENGEIVRSVDQITVAGNFLAMMKGIETVGSDLRFGPPMGGRIGTPSLLIEKLVVSGK